MKISFVIPCYHSEKTIENVVNRIDLTMKNMLDYCYEIILVNDCSKDNTKEVIFRLADRKDIVAIDLAKNSGQHAAMLAGMNEASGDYIVTLDDDGQTPIENLKQMMDKLNEGYDVVSARYIKRDSRSAFRKFGSKVALLTSRWLIERPKDVSVSVFLLLKRFVVEEVVKYKEPFPYIAGLILRTTHNIGNVDMSQQKREHGSSGYNIKKLLNLWLNGFTAFSIKPLRIATFMGILIATIGFIGVIVVIINRMINSNVLVGWSSVIIVNLMLGGLLLFVLGIIGEYIGRIYLSINMTPQYVVKERKTHTK